MASAAPSVRERLPCIPDVARLATFFRPLRGKNRTFQTASVRSGCGSTARRPFIQKLRIWLMSDSRFTASDFKLTHYPELPVSLADDGEAIFDIFRRAWPLCPHIV